MRRRGKMKKDKEFEQCLRALRVIYTWASVPGCLDPKLVRELIEKSLEPFKERKGERTSKVRHEMSDTSRVNDEVAKVQKLHAENGLDDLAHYMDMCASMARMARQLERELAEAVTVANELVHYGDPKPWRIEEWKKAKQKAIGFCSANK
jgi:hypothetical protein